MILTHRDGFSELSVRSPIRGDAGHRKGRATRSESSEKPPFRSPMGRVGGRHQALTMPRIAPGSTCGLLPTRRGPGAIPMGLYHRDLVLQQKWLTRIREPMSKFGNYSPSEPASEHGGSRSPSRHASLGDVRGSSDARYFIPARQLSFIGATDRIVISGIADELEPRDAYLEVRA